MKTVPPRCHTSGSVPEAHLRPVLALAGHDLPPPLTLYRKDNNQGGCDAAFFLRSRNEAAGPPFAVQRNSGSVGDGESHGQVNQIRGGVQAVIHDQKLLRGNGGELHQIADGDTPVLTTAQGVPISDDQNTLEGRRARARR